MELINRVITGGYWGAYYLVYVVGMVYLAYHFRHHLRFPEAGQQDVNALFVAAAICGVSAGTALFVAIIVEVTGRMVLLIPRAWNRAKSIGRTEERDRVRAILHQYGRRDPETGHLVLDLDQDAEERLRNGDGDGDGNGKG